MTYIGPIYELLGLRLQDLDLGCPHCSKRLCEVVADATGQWNAGQTICVDCGVAVHVPREKRQWVLRGSWRAPGLHVAACQLCRYTSMPATLEKAAEFAQAHLASSHVGAGGVLSESGTPGRVSSPQPKLRTVPTTLREANAFVAVHHRHHKPVRGHTSSTAVVDEAGVVRGVAIIGRPLARKIDHRQVCEVLRVATDGCANACSALYGAACRIAKAFGYAHVMTYTLSTDPGTSLRAAGWKPVAVTDGGSWSREGRERDDDHPLIPKVRWACRCSSEAVVEVAA